MQRLEIISDYIDLGKSTICGWEPKKNIILIDAIRIGIEKGDDFKALNLVQLGKNEYSLFPLEISNLENIEGGGHHKAIGHYYLGEKIKSNIYILRDPKKISFIKESRNFLDISYTELFNHTELTYKEKREEETRKFFIRALRYPRIDWEKWNIEPSKEWIEKFKQT